MNVCCLENQSGPRCIFGSSQFLIVVLVLFVWLNISLHSRLSYGMVEDEFQTVVRPFLNRYCVDCHQGAQAEGNLDLEQLSDNFGDLRVKESWAEIVNALHSHQMPPTDSLQPTPESVARVVDWTAQRMVRERESQLDPDRRLRRLNRQEYRNTIRDLLGVEIDVSGFPQDASAGGFDNNGQALTLSPLQLELYYHAAEKALDRIFVQGQQPPKLRWRFQPESGNDDGNRVTYDGQRLIVNGGQNRVENDFVVLHHDNWDRTLNVRDFRLPNPGRYAIRIRAAGSIPNRQDVVASAESFLKRRLENDLRENPRGEVWHRRAYEDGMEHFRSDPMYEYGPPRFKLVQSLGGQPRVIARHDVAAPVSDPEVLEFFADFTSETAGLELFYDYSIPKVLENAWFQTSDDFPRPELWVDWVEIEGPLYDVWPPTAQSRLLQSADVDFKFASIVDAEKKADQILRVLMQRAYRRHVSESEFQEKLEMFSKAYRENADFIEALRFSMLGILISPHFLYLPENTISEGGHERLDDFALANRLAYFLWSSMPDDTLFALATQGKLREPDVLAEQVDRMLRDPKAAALSENFVGQWLGLRQVGANPPAEDLFPRYDRHLEESMVSESMNFFAHILHNDLDVRNLIESDFVVINQRMGRYYGIPGVTGDHFRAVAIPTTVPRGGLVTHASILCLTSNGTRTSPVVRGTWVLKTLLGMDPGLPVANAGEIAPAVPGIDKATVRQRLEIHRTLPQCARCHDKIDPLGFALENYDAAGAFRLQEGFGYKGRVEPDDPQIDASAEMIDGTEFVGATGLKQVLLEREELFLQCLSQKMLTYALGREMSLADFPTIKAASQQMQRQRSLRSLIHWIVKSDAFHTK